MGGNRRVSEGLWVAEVNAFHGASLCLPLPLHHPINTRHYDQLASLRSEGVRGGQNVWAV